MPEPLDASGLRLAVTTPWYPGVRNPFSGSFVQSAVQAVQAASGGLADALVLHSEDWPTPTDPASNAVILHAMRRLLTRPDGTSALPTVIVNEGRLLRVPVAVRARAPYAQHAHRHVESVSAALLGHPIDADVVHGHVGVFGGWVGTRLAEPGTPLFVTEHATFLNRVLAQPEARNIYDQVLERCTLFFCVSEVLRRQLIDAFDRHRDKFVVLPNAVPFERMPARPRPVTELRRWLYVGRLLPHKGVARLLEAFAVSAARDPGLELTLLGGGREAGRLRARAVELGLGDRVHMPGPVPHEEVVAHMHAHDLLVHLSEFETFGMTVVEAVAAGLPVLVTRSGGPQETLAGLEGVAGHTVGVGEDVDEVVAGYEALTGMDLDLPRARSVMESRYSQAAVGRRLLDHYLSPTTTGRNER